MTLHRQSITASSNDSLGKRSLTPDMPFVQIDLRDTSYPGLLEAVGLAITRFDGIERTIPSVFRAALKTSLDFQWDVFEATRGLEVHLKLAEAAIKEGAPNYLAQWQALATKIRSCATERGKAAHAGMSIYGGGLIIELDEEGLPTGIATRAGPPVASLSRFRRQSREEISEVALRELSDRMLQISDEVGRLAAEITLHRSQRLD